MTTGSQNPGGTRRAPSSRSRSAGDERPNKPAGAVDDLTNNAGSGTLIVVLDSKSVEDEIDDEESAIANTVGAPPPPIGTVPALLNCNLPAEL